MIGIIGAMEEEIIALKEKMEIEKLENKANLDFYIGKIDNKDIVLVRCGIGKVNAAICTQILIDRFEVKYVINTGVAGALSSNLDIGDIVISSDAMQHDFDTTVFGYKKGIIPRMDNSIFTADEYLIDIAKKATEDTIDKKIYVERVASGDVFVCDRSLKEDICNSVGGYCAEMEGAAIAHTCYLNSVPFVIIRAISDKADESADMNFDEFVESSAKNSSDIIEKMIAKI